MIPRRQVRRHRLHVALNDLEMAAVRGRVELRGVSYSDWLRDLVRAEINLVAERAP